MDQSQVAPILTALTALIGAIAALIAILRNGTDIKQVKHQADGVISHLQAANQDAQANRATAAELDARPPVPDPDPVSGKITKIGR